MVTCNMLIGLFSLENTHANAPHAGYRGQSDKLIITRGLFPKVDVSVANDVY